MCMFFYPPLQLIDLFVLVILLILHFPKDLQQAVHLNLGLPRILLVAGHFLFEVLNVLGQLSVGLSFQGCVLSLVKERCKLNAALFTQASAARGSMPDYIHPDTIVHKNTFSSVM